MRGGVEVHVQGRSLAVLALLAPLVAACDSEDSCSPGAWQPPLATAHSNPAYPACVASNDCPFLQRCDPGASSCTADPGPWTAAPDFSLRDLNPNSATHGRTLTLSSQHGLVTVLYFGYASCPICMQQVVRLQELLERLAAAGTPGVIAMIVNDPRVENYVPMMGCVTRLPILQEGDDFATWSRFLAAKDSFVVVDGNGFVRARFDPLYIHAQAADLDALEQAIRAAADQGGHPGHVLGVPGLLGATIGRVR